MTTPNDPLEFKNSIPIHDQKFLEKQNKNQFLPGQKKTIIHLAAKKRFT